MVENLLGVKQVPILFEKKDRGWRFEIPKIIDGAVEPIEGASSGGVTKVTNSKYWMAPDITVCQGTRSRLRDWGRNWDLSGMSAEYAHIEWEGP
jgi:hypothetical protein